MASLLHVICNTVYDVLPDCLFCLNIGWQEIQAAYLIISQHSEWAVGGGENEETQEETQQVSMSRMSICERLDMFGHLNRTGHSTLLIQCSVEAVKLFGKHL